MELFTLGKLLDSLSDIDNVTEGGYILSTNQSMVQWGVKREVIEDFGYYSIEATQAMAALCKKNHHVDIGIGISGKFQGDYKLKINKSEGLSMINLKKDGSIHAIYYTLDTPIGSYSSVVEVPDIGGIKSLQREYVIGKILEKLEEILEKGTIIEDKKSCDINNIEEGDDYDEEDYDYDEDENKSVKNTIKTIIKVAGVLTIGIAAIALKNKLKRK